MQQGKYRPIPRRWKELYSIFPFSNNLQIWLSIFAFSTFAVSSLFTLFEDMDAMMPIPTIPQSLALLTVGIAFLLSIIIAGWSLVSLVVLFIKGYFGERIKYNPETTNQSILKAITPIKRRAKTKGKEVSKNGNANKRR